jgi:nucleotide-binding universal stress UspA family protein
MVFRRRHEKPGALLAFDRILLPLSGGEVDAPALKLASMLLAAHPGEASLLHVIEVPFDRQLDMQDDASLARAEGILRGAEQFLESQKIAVRTSTVQARAAGAAIVDDANEFNADLILMGLRYKKRFGGQWDAGRTVPYVMRNSTAPVWCLRAETKELAQTP